MRHRLFAFSLVPLAATLLSGCFSTEVTLDYVPNPSSQLGGPKVALAGLFTDERHVKAANYIGTTRSRLGDPLEHVYLALPVSETVENAFTEALEARGMKAAPGHAKFVFQGTVEDFYCQLLTKPYAFARIRVDLVDASTGRVIFHHAYETERQGAGYLRGYDDPVPMMKDLAARTLQDVVDRAIDSPEVRSHMAHYGVVVKKKVTKLVPAADR